jgi:WD40 repeat protein
MILTKSTLAIATFLALTLAAVAGTLALQVAGGAEPKSGRVEQPQPGREPKGDLHGDPLPPSGVGRMGTVRFRHADDVRAISLSPDGKQLATAGGSEVVVWDAATGRTLSRFEGHGATVHAVTIAPDGRSIASGGDDNVIRLWDTATGKELRRFMGHGPGPDDIRPTIKRNGVYAVAITLDGNTLVSRGVDRTIRMWDVATGKEIGRLDALPGWWRSLAVSPDGKTLAAVVSDFPKAPTQVRLWAVATGNEVRRLHHAGFMTCVAFSPDGKLLAVGWGADGNGGANSGGAVKLWEVATGKQAGALDGHNRLVVSVTFSRDGKMLLSGSMDCTNRLWDVSTARELVRVGEGMAPVYAAAFSPDSKLLLMQTGFVGDHAVRFWDVAAAKEIRRLNGHRSTVAVLAFSPNGRQLASGCADVIGRELGD